MLDHVKKYYKPTLGFAAFVIGGFIARHSAIKKLNDFEEAFNEEVLKKGDELEETPSTTENSSDS